MGYEPTTLRDLQCSGMLYHWASEDSVVSKGQIVGIDWSRIAWLRTLACSYELTNSITLSH